MLQIGSFFFTAKKWVPNFYDQFLLKGDTWSKSKLEHVCVFKMRHIESVPLSKGSFPQFSSLKYAGTFLTTTNRVNVPKVNLRVIFSATGYLWRLAKSDFVRGKFWDSPHVSVGFLLMMLLFLPLLPVAFLFRPALTALQYLSCPVVDAVSDWWCHLILWPSIMLSWCYDVGESPKNYSSICVRTPSSTGRR